MKKDVKSITLNGKNYPAAEFDYNNVATMEEMGVDLFSGNVKQMSLVRAYVAICMNSSKEEAGLEIEKHLIAGGTFDEINEAISVKGENSDFFRALKEAAEKKA